MKELGMGLADGGDAAARRFSAWRSKIRSDPDVGRDARMMVPVFYDVQRRKTKVWAFPGWRTTDVDVEYRMPPAVLAVEPSPAAGQPSGDPPPVEFTTDRDAFS